MLICKKENQEIIRMEGYLFGHFIGEGDENGEQIYFAVSEDGLHFKDLKVENQFL